MALLVAAIIGTVGGLISSSATQGGATGQLFDAWYNISSDPSGYVSRFDQDWHGGTVGESQTSCPPPGPTSCALDWRFLDAARRVEFRGGFKRSGASQYTLHTHNYQWYAPNHPLYCAQITTDVHENHLEVVHGLTNHPRWGVQFFHTQLRTGVPAGSNIFTVPTSYGNYGSFWVGTGVTQDNGFWCDFEVPHVHDELWMGSCPYGLPGYNRRGINPPPPFFIVGQNYHNNQHWTRHMQWGEGGTC